MGFLAQVTVAVKQQDVFQQIFGILDEKQSKKLDQTKKLVRKIAFKAAHSIVGLRAT